MEAGSYTPTPWSKLSAAERGAILASRAEERAAKEARGYIFPRKKKLAKPMRAKEVYNSLAIDTGCTRAEARFWFEAVAALIQHELEHERDFRIPGVGTLMPGKEFGLRHFNMLYQTYSVSPTWVRVRFRVDKDLKQLYRKKYPHYFESAYETTPKIEDLC